MRRRRSGPLAGAAVTAAAVALLLIIPLARADLVAHGDLFVKFSGDLSPAALPRHTPAPVAVGMSGVVRTLSGARPPALRQIAIAINRNALLDTDGLPRCREDQLVATSDQEALRICGRALVGGGTYLANTAFPEQEAFPSNGHILAFNGAIDGHRAVLAHIYGLDPVPITRVIVFNIRQDHSAFGTVLTGNLPETLNHYGYVKKIALSLHRNFNYRGARHSYLSAACAALPGFPGAVFPFAHASMTFADGRMLSSTLTRSCTVR
jgi:hypothetical protein